jgi:arsenate reductase
MIPFKTSRSIMTITIYHNPRCGTSRNTLALIRNSGAEPIIIEYLLDPPNREQLRSLIRQAGLTVRQALREKETLCAELGLLDAGVGDDRLLDAMLAHPILINRPFVVTERGVRLCRPSELVLDILPAPQQGPFNKEDGEPVIDHAGNRVR